MARIKLVQNWAFTLFSIFSEAPLNFLNDNDDDLTSWCCLINRRIHVLRIKSSFFEPFLSVNKTKIIYQDLDKKVISSNSESCQRWFTIGTNLKRFRLETFLSLGLVGCRAWKFDTQIFWLFLQIKKSFRHLFLYFSLSPFLYLLLYPYFSQTQALSLFLSLFLSLLLYLLTLFLCLADSFAPIHSITYMFNHLTLSLILL